MNVKNQEGSTLVELAFCAVIIFIALGIVGRELARFSVSSELAEIGERARAYSDDALNALIALPASELPAQSGFNVAAGGNSIEITAPCTVNSCDYVLLTPFVSESLAKGIKYGSTPNTDYYLRRWKVEDADTSLTLKKITVVILQNETSTVPIRIESTVNGFTR